MAGAEVDGRDQIIALDYRDIRNNTVPEARRQSIRNTGCAVVRGVFPAGLARDWFARVGAIGRLLMEEEGCAVERRH